VFTTLVVTCALAGPLSAQPRVTLEIRASIPGEAGRRLPVIGRFWLVWDNDSVAILTGGDGVGRTEALAGSYRIRTYQRVSIGAIEYYWDVPVRLTRGTALDLTERNAQSTPPTGRATAVVMDDSTSNPPIPDLPVHAPASVQATLAAAPLPYRQEGDPGYRDPSVGRVLGIVIPGAGHLYAGETAKGLGLLAVGGLGAGFLISQLPCGGGGNQEPCDTPMLAFGAAAYLVSEIYSIVDAAPAARRANVIRPQLGLFVLPRDRFGLGIRVPLEADLIK
jgi:hypothetical protein